MLIFATTFVYTAVLSGDTIILRSEQAPPKGQAAKERVVHLAGVSAPRLGSMSREDEPFAFASREFLRPQLVGKLVQYQIVHTVEASKTATNGAPVDREYGIIKMAPLQPGGQPQDVAMVVVANGWAKVREGGGEGEELIRRLGADEAKRREGLRAAEAEAQAAGKGMWVEGGEPQRTVHFQMPTDSQAFIDQYKGKEIDAIVEQVRDGSSIRVRLLLDDGSHQYINLALAGVKSPKAMSGRDGEANAPSEEWGEEAKFFTESRLLQRAIKVQLLSAPVSLGAVPQPGAGGKSSNGFGLPAPQTVTSNIMIGTALHPVGNIAEFLLGAGLAKVVDWHAGLLSSAGGMDKLRAAEKSAKEKKLGIWENYVSPAASRQLNGQQGNGTNGASAAGSTATHPTTKGTEFDATVVRIWGADTVSVIEKSGSAPEKERRLQLSSIRGARGSDPKQMYWAAEAKEFLRKKLIGKTVHVHVDYVKPKEGDFEEKECVTIKYGGAQANVAEQLVEKGLATVLRHRRDDEDRSPELDKLIVAEQKAVTEGKGIHSPKDVSLPRIVDASESGTKAAQFLPSWKRAGKHVAVVDFVPSGSRFKLFLPKENKKITFVLAGVKAPRAARSANEKGEPYGAEGQRWSNLRYLQRDVDITFDSVDKQGGFIGTMFSNGSNVAVDLVREGLATTHSYSADNLPYAKELYAAEEEAKKAKRNIWADYEETVQVQEQPNGSGALAPEYLDVVVSSVKESGPFGFSVQILTKDSVATLEQLMKDFSLHNKTAKAPAGYTPRVGEMVSAQFSEDNQWSVTRGKDPASADSALLFVHSGNEETVPFSKIRPIDAKFKTLPDQAQEARLSFVQLVPVDKDYGLEALDRFRQLTEGRRLIANVDQRDGQLLHLRLIDPTDPNSATDPMACLNADLIREGLATIDKTCRYAEAYPQVLSKLRQGN
ncbi:hypothetical protein QFC24_004414 [Naganishia onofrii]|uniref:Uncharacterized protein n=1 Tax=Naganishia onofrii TaxID=1851511 RepID=A0ACC2XDR8_9TREE|nr:hypothetical protein QFC24_004414 [Naganishia onofrii]